MAGLPGSVFSPPGQSGLPGTVLSTPQLSTPPATNPGTQLSTTSTSSASMSSPTPTFSFNAIPDMTTCTSASIGWQYTGFVENTTLTVTNHLFNDPQPGISLTRRQQTSNSSLIIFQLATNVNPQDSPYVWSKVSVPAGSYVISANVANVGITRSAQFSVVNGPDTSCLLTSSSSSSATVPVTSASTSSPSASLLPVAGSLSSSSNHAAAIAGGVIGGLAFLAAIVAALVFLRICRSSPTRARRRAADAPGGPEVMGKWNGLSSRDSSINATGLPLPSAAFTKPTGRVHRQTDSTGPMISGPNSSSGHGMTSAPTSPGGSDEDISTIGEEEKLPASPRGQFDYIETVAPLSSYGNRRNSVALSAPSSPTRNGVKSTNRALALAKLDPAAGPFATPTSTPPHTPFHRNRQSLDGRVLSSPVEGSPFGIASSPPMSGEMIPMNRSSSGGARRAARKPVPTYHVSEFGARTTSPVQSEQTEEDGRMASPTMLHGTRSGSSSSTNVHVEGYSREDLEAAGLELPNLNHKSSFGHSQAVHYLIPDMPPPPRN